MTGIIIRVTPFLYCGILVFIFFFAFFFIKSISPDRKIGIFLIVAFLLLSTFFVRVDWAWHIFQLPNWFPYRYSFVISFMLGSDGGECVYAFSGNQQSILLLFYDIDDVRIYCVLSEAAAWNYKNSRSGTAWFSSLRRWDFCFC